MSRTATAPVDRVKLLLQVQDGAIPLTVRGGWSAHGRPRVRAAQTAAVQDGLLKGPPHALLQATSSRVWASVPAGSRFAVVGILKCT